MQLEKIQTWLNCHYKFISTKIVTLFLSIKDFPRLV